MPVIHLERDLGTTDELTTLPPSPTNSNALGPAKKLCNPDKDSLSHRNTALTHFQIILEGHGPQHRHLDRHNEPPTS